MQAHISEKSPSPLGDFFVVGDSDGCHGAGAMALNGKRSLTLTEWQSLPLVAEWQALRLFVATFSAPPNTSNTSNDPNLPTSKCNHGIRTVAAVER